MGPTTATLSVTTNRSDGALYTVVTTSATAPSVAQIKAGQDSLGTAAAFAASAAVTSPGVKTFNAIGLTPSTAYFAYFMHEGLPAEDSSVVATSSFTTSATPDTTAPVLTFPTGVKTGQTTASINVVTNEGNGTLYWVLTQSATPPTAAQVKAGLNETDALAVRSGNQLVTTTGVLGPSGITGLTPSTAYFTYFMQQDAAGNQSLVAAAPAFTTDTAADTTPPILSLPSGIKTGSSTATLGVSTNEANGTLYWVMTQSSTTPSAAQVKAGQNNTGAAADKSGNQAVTVVAAQGPISVTALASSTTYFTYFMHEDAAGNRSTVAASVALTTDAPSDTTAPLLSAATGSSTGQTTANLNVTSNEASGRLYWVLTTSTTPPTAAQIKLGQNNLGTPAVKSGNQPVIATGVQAASVTGLTASTLYVAYFMQEDAALNQSLVAGGALFTTDAIPVPILSAPTDSAVSSTTASLSVTTNTGNGVVYVVVTTSATAPTAAQVKAGLTNTSTVAPFAANLAVTTAGVKSFTATGLSGATAYFTYFMHENSTAGQSLVSAADGFTTSAIPDTIAPVLSSPTATATSFTVAAIGVTSSEANGILYWVITRSATTPTKAQIKAGQNNTGATADRSGNQSVTAIGVQAISVTSLAPGTNYFAHFMQEDAALNQSNAVSSSGFTTPALAPVLTAPTDTTTGPSTATLTVTTDTAVGTLYTVVTGSATPPTAAQVKAGQTNTGAAAPFAANQVITSIGVKTFSATGLAPSTPYFTYFMHDNVPSAFSLVAAADGFTTAAPPLPRAPTLSLASPSSDATPDLDVGLPNSPVDGTEARVGDTLRVQVQITGGDWSTAIDYVVHSLVAGDLTGSSINATASTLVAATYDFRARLERPGVGNSAWSATVSGTISIATVSGSYDAFARSFAQKPGVVNPADGALRSDADSSGGGSGGGGTTIAEDAYMRAQVGKPGTTTEDDASLRAMTDRG